MVCQAWEGTLHPHTSAQQLPSRSRDASQHGYSATQMGARYAVLVALPGKDTTKGSS